MQVEAIKLRFKTPVHFGSGKDEMNSTSFMYHSDSLKSALFSVGIVYYPEWKESPDTFFNSFRISSCFPFCSEELFLPRPFGLMKFTYGDSEKDDKNRKISKKVSFLSLELIRKWSKNPEEELPIEASYISPDGAFVFANGENVRAIYQNEVQQRVTIDMQNMESTPFYLDRLYFEKDTGLYFLLECQDEELRKKLFTILRLLGEMGIGTDRTVGNGLFSFDESKDVKMVELPKRNVLNKKINLGLYLPQREEMQKIQINRSFWNITKRSGYIAAASKLSMRSLRRNNIFFFTEGSVFDTDSTLQGRYVDLKPAWDADELHPVWRDGQPIFMRL